MRVRPAKRATGWIARAPGFGLATGVIMANIELRPAGAVKPSCCGGGIVHREDRVHLSCAAKVGEVHLPDEMHVFEVGMAGPPCNPIADFVSFGGDHRVFRTDCTGGAELFQALHQGREEAIAGVAGQGEGPAGRKGPPAGREGIAQHP